jgi:hypothetical protein
MFSLGCGRSGSSATAQPRRPWETDKKWLDQLDAPAEIAGYVLQPPKGYKRIAANSPPISLITWESPPRAGSNRAALMASVVDLPNPNDPKHSAEQVLNDALGANQPIMTQWQKTPTDRGKLSGIDFVRAECTGMDRFREKTYMRVILYVARDGNRLIQLAVRQESSNPDDDFFGLAEAGLLTFRKK